MRSFLVVEHEAEFLLLMLIIRAACLLKTMIRSKCKIKTVYNPVCFRFWEQENRLSLGFHPQHP